MGEELEPKISTVDGKYKILDQIGGGAFSTVYSVEGQMGVCALKLLKERGTATDRISVEEFKREFTILKDLSHPHIAHILDFGFDETISKYFFTSEFIQGSNLFDATESMPITQITDLIVQSLRALEYMHSSLVYHFDIKAANILVTEKSSTVKLIDFGLAGIDPRGCLIGTPSYMAPEIISGQEADGRADLYSLGIVWYYCLTRTNPFRARTADATFKQQLKFKPEPPSHINKEIPAWMDAVILRMIAKNPEDRFPRALRIIREINRFVEKKYPLETRETLLSYLPEEGHFIGRHHELEVIKDGIFRLKGEVQLTEIWAVIGPRGSGRTRFLREIKYMAQLSDVRVSFASAADTKGFDLWLLHLNEHLNHDKGPELFLLDDLQDLGDEQKSWERLATHLSHSRRPGANAPTMIVLGLREGVIPPSFHRYMERLATRILPIGNFSTEELSAYIASLTGIDHPPQSLLDGIISRTEGNPLFVTEVMRSLIENGALFGYHGRWNESLFEDVGVDFSRIVVPHTLGDLILERIGELTKEEKLIMEVLAIIGHQAMVHELASWVGIPHIRPSIVHLIQKGFLKDVGGACYDFKNALTSQVILERLTKEQRCRLHDLLANALVSTHASEEVILHHKGMGSDIGRAREALAQLSAIHLRYGRGRKAEDYLRRLITLLPESEIQGKIDYGMQLGEAFLITHRYEEAAKEFLSLIQFVRRLPKDLQPKFADTDLHVRLGGARMKQNDFNGAIEVFDAAKIALSKADGDVARGLIIDNFRANALFLDGKIKEACDIFTASKATWHCLPQADKFRVTNNDLGPCLLALGKTADARVEIEEDVAVAKEHGDDLLIARAHYNLAMVALAEGRKDEAIRQYLSCADVCKHTANEELLLRAYNGLGNLYRQFGNFEQSVAYYERGLALHDRLGDASGGAILSINLGIVEGERKRLDAALDSIVPSVEYLQSLAHPTANERAALLRGLLEMGDVLYKKGEFDKAHESLLQARSIDSEEKSAFRFWILLTLARILVAKGNTSDATSICDELGDMVISDEERKALAELLENAKQNLPPPKINHHLEPVFALPRKEALKDSESAVPQPLLISNANRYQKVLEINKLINAESDLKYVLHTVLFSAMELAGAERGAILLADAWGALEVKCQHNMGYDVEGAAFSHTLASRVLEGGSFIVTNDASIDNRFSAESSIALHRFRSILCMPVRARRQIIGVLYLDHRVKAGAFADVDLNLLDAFTDQAGLAIENARLLQKFADEGERLEQELVEASNRITRYEEALRDGPVFVPKFIYGVAGKSRAMQEIFRLLDKIANTDLSILLFGESGTGKELIARALHNNHLRRHAKRFVAVNCGAIPATLMESELFGYKAGAFTGAVRDKKGLFEEADGGTLFLDEVGELDTLLQVKLLRALQERECVPVGGTKPVRCDVRVVAATNRDLEIIVKEKEFRDDLYYRLCQIKVHIPPLRQRREDIALLVQQFIDEALPGRKMSVDSAFLRSLIDYTWPGNVRELKNLIEVACALAEGSVIDWRAVPGSTEIAKKFLLGEDSSLTKHRGVIESSGAYIDENNPYTPSFTWHDYEKVIVAKAFEANSFDVRQTADELKMAVTTLYKRVKEWNLKDKRNPLYSTPFTHIRNRTLVEYLRLVFCAAYNHAGKRPFMAIANLKVSQGYFYKVMKGFR